MRKDLQAARRGWSLDEEKRKEWRRRPAELGGGFPPGSAPRTGSGGAGQPREAGRGRAALRVKTVLWGWTGGKRGVLEAGERGRRSGEGERARPSRPGLVSGGRGEFSGLPVQQQGPVWGSREKPANLQI